MDLSHIITDYFSTAPLFAAYAEMHYRFKFVGSRYFLNEPEIIADIPYRIDPTQKIPILILIKDSHQYPIIFKSYTITISKDSKIIFTKSNLIDKEIREPWWQLDTHVDINGISGLISIDVIIDYTINEKQKSCINHNLPLLQKRAFETIVAETSLPGSEKTIWGDLHYHTNLTDDMVEFGAPMDSTLLAARAIGLDFYCCTDHSYDLDDLPGSWIKTDPELTKWNHSRKEIIEINRNNQECIIASEEVTLRNMKGRNVHALLLNNKTFIPGSGDGAEKLIPFSSEHSTIDVYELMESDSILIAAHPLTHVPLFQWLFVKRGKWMWDDLIQPGLTGMQILNGSLDSGFFEGRDMWIRLLLDGYKKYIYAGNDAHGNFNIFRQIKTPMLSVHEKKEQIFGDCRTGLLSDSKSPSGILSEIKSGNCIITNGPYINLVISNNGHDAKLGETVYFDTFDIKLDGISSPEFGRIIDIRLFKGNIGEESENCIIHKSYENSIYNDSLKEKYIYEVDCYYRGEILTIDSAGIEHMGMTNPIWVMNNK